eukprot:366000-Chlamydomonas_euryale.AAC.9
MSIKPQLCGPLFASCVAKPADLLWHWWSGGALVPYYLDESTGWGLNIERLNAAVKSAREEGLSVRALVFINPGNPTGQCLSRRNLEELIKFAHEKRIVLMADEVYQVLEAGPPLMLAKHHVLCPAPNTTGGGMGGIVHREGGTITTQSRPAEAFCGGTKNCDGESMMSSCAGMHANLTSYAGKCVPGRASIHRSAASPA